MSMWDPNGYDENSRHGGRDDEPRSSDPYAADGTWGQDPSARDPSAQDVYATDAYATGTDGVGPYAAGSGGADPYGRDSSYPPSDPGTGAGQGTLGPQYGPVSAPYGPGGAAPYHGMYAPPAPTSAMGLTGFILGIASLILCAGLPAPVGLVFSILGMRETGPNAESVKSGRGFAIAGLVLSILGTLVLAFFVAYIVFLIGVGVFAGSTS